MKYSTIILTAALAMTGLAALTPAVGALDVGCQRVTDVSTVPAGTSTLFTPSGADVLGWTPECIVVSDNALITFAQRDVIGHGVETACFEMPTMSLGEVTTLRLSLDAESGLVFTEENGTPGFCEGLGIEGDGTLTVDYWCKVHGKAMPGKIVVEL